MLHYYPELDLVHIWYLLLVVKEDENYDFSPAEPVVIG